MAQLLVNLVIPDAHTNPERVQVVAAAVQRLIEQLQSLPITVLTEASWTLIPTKDE